VSFTRRTHIVRIAPPDSDPKDPGEFVDVEVLDAIAYRIANNKEVVLKFDPKADAYIVDDTGGGHEKKPDNASSRSHMKRVQSSDGENALDVEVIDCWAARGINNAEWILDMQPGTDGSDDFNISDSSGDSKSTRRVHNEIVTDPPGKTKSDAGKNYLTSVRSDNIAFRTINNREVILSMTSCDDPNAQGVDFGRASTHTTPEGYDPNDESDSAVKPPSLADSGDQHNYIKFVDDGKGSFKGLFTLDEKIEMGPLWWIRKIKNSGDYLSVEFSGGESDTHLADFFDTITFGGDGTGDGADLSKADLSAQFFGFDGSDGQAIVSGGAGVFDDGTAIIGPFDNGFTAAMLSAKIELSSGKKVSGFAISHHRNTSAGVTYYLKLSDLGSGDINLFVSTGPEQPYPVSLATFQKSVVKVGAGGPATEIDDKYEQKITLPGGSDWGGISVNTKTLKFTIPAGELGNGITGILDLGRGAEAPPMP
jgi:hypothetical protein